MRTEIQKKALKALLDEGYSTQFNSLDKKPADKGASNPFIVKWGATYLELKDEFKDDISKMSIADLLQITQSSDIKSIKGWVKFFGVLVILQIIAGIIIAVSILG